MILPKALLLPFSLQGYPPRADEIMNFGYNIFLGTTPEEQRESFPLENPKLFDYDGGLFSFLCPDTDSTYRKYAQFLDLSSQPTCGRGDAGGVAATLSGSTMLDASFIGDSSISNSYRAPSIIEGLAGIISDAAKLLTIDKVVVSGNAKASLEAKANLDAGFKFGYTSYAYQKLYAAQNNFDSAGSISTWTRPLKNAVNELSSNPSIANVLNFFSKFGTHGIDSGVFGQKCENSIYMRAGLTTSAYMATLADVSASGHFDLTGDNFAGGVGEGEGAITGQVGSMGEAYFTTGRRCAGKNPSISDCGFSFPAVLNPTPILLDFSYKAIWEMNIPGLEDTAKNEMKDVAVNLAKASIECGEIHCNGGGVCAADTFAWENIEANSGDLLRFWDGGHCVCFDGDLLDKDCMPYTTPQPTPAPTRPPEVQYSCRSIYKGVLLDTCVAHPISWYSEGCGSYTRATATELARYNQLPKLFDIDPYPFSSDFRVVKDNGWQYCGGGGQHKCEEYVVECEIVPKEK